jgi:predicted secreted acid phosphatase
MYGDWENTIYEYNLELTEAEKAAKRKSLLKTYQRKLKALTSNK